MQIAEEVIKIRDGAKERRLMVLPTACKRCYARRRVPLTGLPVIGLVSLILTTVWTPAADCVDRWKLLDRALSVSFRSTVMAQ